MTSKCMWCRKRVSSHDRPVFITSFPREKAREMIQTQIRLDKYESQCLSHIPLSQNHPCLVLLGPGESTQTFLYFGGPQKSS